MDKLKNSTDTQPQLAAKAEEFGRLCAIAVRESRAHRELIGRLFTLRRSPDVNYDQEFVSRVVLPDFRSRKIR